jgi:TonB family protein
MMHRSVRGISILALSLLCCSGSMIGQAGSSRPVEAIVLSDTQGVDFGPYMRQVMSMVRKAWASSVAQGAVQGNSEAVIRFTINQDGKISAMQLVDSAHDVALDRAAWGSITGAGEFPALPASFSGPGLTLDIHFKLKPAQS